MKINMNDKVKVKLSEKGLRLLRLKFIDYPELFKSYTKVDENGYSEFQLWKLMSFFGEHIGNGCEIPFETDILIK